MRWRTRGSTFTTACQAARLNPSAFGQSVTFSATVTSTGVTPTVNVTFKDGNKTLGTVPLSGGQAMLSTASLKRGSHSITATFSGPANFAGSVSAVLTQVVN